MHRQTKNTSSVADRQQRHKKVIPKSTAVKQDKDNDKDNDIDFCTSLLSRVLTTIFVSRCWPWSLTAVALSTPRKVVVATVPVTQHITPHCQTTLYTRHATAHSRMKINLLLYQIMSSLSKSRLKTRLFDPAYNCRQ